jgi:hypothetical protein
VHGALMCVSWVLLLPWGAFVARFRVSIGMDSSSAVNNYVAKPPVSTTAAEMKSGDRVRVRVWGYVSSVYVCWYVHVNVCVCVGRGGGGGERPPLAPFQLPSVSPPSPLAPSQSPSFSPPLRLTAPPRPPSTLVRTTPSWRMAW